MTKWVDREYPTYNDSWDHIGDCDRGYDLAVEDVIESLKMMGKVLEVFGFVYYEDPINYDYGNAVLMILM